MRCVRVRARVKWNTRTITMRYTVDRLLRLRIICTANISWTHKFVFPSIKEIVPNETLESQNSWREELNMEIDSTPNAS